MSWAQSNDPVLLIFHLLEIRHISYYFTENRAQGHQGKMLIPNAY